jgi:hypothetical protein
MIDANSRTTQRAFLKCRPCVDHNYVSGHPIGKNQGVQSPSPSVMPSWKRRTSRAAAMFEAGLGCGANPNMPPCKLMADSPSRMKYDIERKWREACIYQVALCRQT